MKTIEYSGDGIVLADMKCEQYAKDFLTDPSGKDEQIKGSHGSFHYGSPRSYLRGRYSPYASRIHLQWSDHSS